MQNVNTPITRLVLLGILLINQALVTFGWDPLPWSEDEIGMGVSIAATGIMMIYTWWKNNAVTKEAKAADEEMRRQKALRKASNK